MTTTDTCTGCCHNGIATDECQQCSRLARVDYWDPAPLLTDAHVAGHAFARAAGVDQPAIWYRDDAPLTWELAGRRDGQPIALVFGVGDHCDVQIDATEATTDAEAAVLAMRALAGPVVTAVDQLRTYLRSPRAGWSRYLVHGVRTGWRLGYRRWAPLPMRGSELVPGLDMAMGAEEAARVVLDHERARACSQALDARARR